RFWSSSCRHRTLALPCCRKRERGTSGRCLPSPAPPGSAKPWAATTSRDGLAFLHRPTPPWHRNGTLPCTASRFPAERKGCAAGRFLGGVEPGEHNLVEPRGTIGIEALADLVRGATGRMAP